MSSKNIYINPWRINLLWYLDKLDFSSVTRLKNLMGDEKTNVFVPTIGR